MSPRGTARSPGADPTRLPLGLDLRAISIVEGVRAGLAAALPIAASVWLNQPVLSLAALGALLTCIVDPGGPPRRRLPVLVAMGLGGGILLGGFGLVRSLGIPATLAFAAPALFCSGFLRVWGQATLALGNLLAVVLLLGTDEPLGLQQALLAGSIFAAGGAWAVLLTFAIWRIHPYGPARRAVADVWDALAGLARELQRVVEIGVAGGETEAAWESHARAGRGAVRNAIERARATLMETVDTRGPTSGSTAQNLMRLEAADQIFAALIALADLLENAEPTVRNTAAAMLRRLRPLLLVMATAIEREQLQRMSRLERSIAAMAADAAACTELGPVTRLIAERLRVATKLIDPAQYLPGSGDQGDAGIPLRDRLLGPAQANWSRKSASLRHALRVSFVVTSALAGTLVYHGLYTHWLTITLVLVMQPFFATTWQRTLERVGGTLLGGVVAAGLSALLHTRLHLAGLLPALGALALAVRQVSYGVYIAVYTPVVILLVEQIRPGQDQVHIALARAGFTVLGGLIAVAANALLWPSWQPAQVQSDLGNAIRAHAAFASAVLEGGDALAARRAAGLASNNLEASLQRAMHEPRRGQRDRLQAVLVADATLRRIAGRLTALSLDPATLGASTSEAAVATKAWIPKGLAALAELSPPPARPQLRSGFEGIDRLARQVELLGGALDRLGHAGDAVPAIGR